MKIIWHPQAKDALAEVAKYIQTRFGTTARKTFLTKVRDEERLLKDNPHIGKPDPLFNGRSKAYHT
ncbi:MAG: type II toxin-antitoxin system RelE/ParE family toxin [Bacteroidales bacterium]|nr:type II toxin-antitoxin system RelE/ParE family toxin [Bacteroidales bacterium]